jgi:hypothetical protein
MTARQSPTPVAVAPDVDLDGSVVDGGSEEWLEFLEGDSSVSRLSHAGSWREAA